MLTFATPAAPTRMIRALFRQISICRRRARRSRQLRKRARCRQHVWKLLPATPWPRWPKIVLPAWLRKQAAVASYLAQLPALLDAVRTLLTQPKKAAGAATSGAQVKQGSVERGG